MRWVKTNVPSDLLGLRELQPGKGEELTGVLEAPAEPVIECLVQAKIG